MKPKILHKTSEKQTKPFGKRTKSNQINTERASRYAEARLFVSVVVGEHISPMEGGRSLN